MAHKGPWSYHVLNLLLIAAALIFALAPLNTQPVNYIAHLRRRWVPGSVLFALALLTKAIAVTFPAVLVLRAVV
jgi:hypothetical protein